MTIPSREQLLEEERQRFERSLELALGHPRGWAKKARSGDGYGERVAIGLSWLMWRLAVGLDDPDAPPPIVEAPEDLDSEHIPKHPDYYRP